MMKPKKKPLPNYIKYSSMAFQMGAMVFLSVFAGIELDKWVETLRFPLFTIIFSLTGVFGAVYYFIQDITKNGKS